METTLQVRVQANGHARGTVGWLNEEMTHCAVVIKHSRAANPSAWLKRYANDDPAKCLWSECLALYTSDYSRLGEAPQIVTWDLLNAGQDPCIGTIPLTAACAAALDRLAQQCVPYLQAYLDDGDTVACNYRLMPT